MRVLASDKGLLEVDSLDGRTRYRRDAGGGFDVSERDAKAAIAWGCFVGSAMGPISEPTKVGYRCSCGFGSWFTTCSRCGGTAVREG